MHSKYKQKLNGLELSLVSRIYACCAAMFPLSGQSWWALTQVLWTDSKTEVCKKGLNK